jgi:protein CMS1
VVMCILKCCALNHSRRMTIGVGTPLRISSLLDEGQSTTKPEIFLITANALVGALSAKHLKRIVVDASYIDQKKRGILDMKDTQPPLIKLLTRADFKERYGAKEKGIHLMFY